MREPRHCVFYKCVARFVGDSWGLCSLITACWRILIGVQSLRKITTFREMRLPGHNVSAAVLRILHRDMSCHRLQKFLGPKSDNEHNVHSTLPSSAVLLHAVCKQFAKYLLAQCAFWLWIQSKSAGCCSLAYEYCSGTTLHITLSTSLTMTDRLSARYT